MPSVGSGVSSADACIRLAASVVVQSVVDAHLAIRLGANGIIDARDHLADGEYLLGDLRGHDIGVVALGDGDEDVGPVQPGFAQRVLVQTRADHALALEPRAEPPEGVTGQVDDRDGVAFQRELPGQRGADAPAAQDDDRRGVAVVSAMICRLPPRPRPRRRGDSAAH